MGQTGRALHGIAVCETLAAQPCRKGGLVMTDRKQKTIRLPVFPGIAMKNVELAKGYEFGKPRGSSVEIFETRKKDDGPGATLKCTCNASKGGSCRLTVSQGIATCSNDTCTNCGFFVVVTSDAFMSYLMKAFEA